MIMESNDSKKPAYNVNNPSVKRIMREVKEMEKENNPDFIASPLEDNIFEWHFTIRGPRDSDFEGGVFHGRIILPPEYPLKPPNIVLLTPNGRFEVGKKICLSISAHHPEYWQPSWSIRTVLVALISFMPTKGDGAIGAIDYTTPERRELAIRSRNWKCDRCTSTNGSILPPDKIPDLPSNENIEKTKPPSQIQIHPPPIIAQNNNNINPIPAPIPLQNRTENELNINNQGIQQRTNRQTNQQNISAPNSQNLNNIQPEASRGDRILDMMMSFILFVILGLLLKKLFG